MSRCSIYTEVQTPAGRTIRYNVDRSSKEMLGEVYACEAAGQYLEIPNEEPGEDPIYLNPDKIVAIVPKRED